jgi:hypothetical protein
MAIAAKRRSDIEARVLELKPDFAKFVTARSKAQRGKPKARPGRSIDEVHDTLVTLMKTPPVDAVASYVLFDGFQGIEDDFMFGATSPVRLADVADAYASYCEDRKGMKKSIPIATSEAGDVWSVDAKNQVWCADFDEDPTTIATDLGALFRTFAAIYDKKRSSPGTRRTTWTSTSASWRSSASSIRARRTGRPSSLRRLLVRRR